VALAFSVADIVFGALSFFQCHSQGSSFSACCVISCLLDVVVEAWKVRASSCFVWVLFLH
jgi:hypothetical protein